MKNNLSWFCRHTSDCKNFTLVCNKCTTNTEEALACALRHEQRTHTDMAQQETPGPHADPKQGPALEQMSHFLDTA